MREQFKRKWKFVIPMLLWCIVGVVNHGMNEVQAEWYGEYGKYGEYTYDVLYTGTVEISHYDGSDTEIVIPSVIDGKSVTSIGSRVFCNCSSLSSIKVNAGNEIYDSRDNCNAIIEKSSDTLIIGCNTTIIPSSVTSIGEFAFDNYESLSNIELPSSVTSIEYRAFSDCSSLSSMEIPANVTLIGDGAFANCSSLSSIEIPASVVDIGARAFSGCSNLSNIKIPSSVTSIEWYAFYDCPSTMVVWTEKDSYAEEWADENGYQVKYIGEDSPSDDENKENSEPSSEENNNNPETPSKSDNTETTTQENNNQTTEATPAETPTTKPSTTTQSTNPSVITQASKGSVLQSKTLKCKVKVLSEDINNPTVEYKGTTNKKSTKIKVPDTVTVDGVTYKVIKVADSALSGNKKVTSVTIGKNVTAIGKNAFKNCTKLKSVDIKSTVLNQIGANAFNGDKKLTKITLKSTKLTKKSVGKNALKGTNKKLVIKVPKKKVSTYKKYFAGKGNKTVKVKK